MVQQFSENVKYQQNLTKIVAHIKMFENEYKKFNDELDKLGKKIREISLIYEDISGVRDRQLTKFINKINSLEDFEESRRVLKNEY